MINKLTLLFILFSLAFSLSCGDVKKTSNTKPAANADVKKGTSPVADNEIAVVETDFGPVKIERYGSVLLDLVKQHS